jgi:ABC-type polysaccharide/polyol phosphate export permease
MFVLVLTTTAYAPFSNLQGWLSDIAHVNPLTQVVEAMRQGFFIDGTISWANTWPGLVAMAGLIAVLGGFALREMRRTSD